MSEGPYVVTVEDLVEVLNGLGLTSKADLAQSLGVIAVTAQITELERELQVVLAQRQADNDGVNAAIAAYTGQQEATRAQLNAVTQAAIDDIQARIAALRATLPAGL